MWLTVPICRACWHQQREEAPITANDRCWCVNTNDRKCTCCYGFIKTGVDTDAERRQVKRRERQAVKREIELEASK